MTSFAVLSDFDGTLVTVDIPEHILKVSVGDSYLVYDHLYLQGKISLEECIKKEYSLITWSEHEILTEVDRVTSFRPNADKFVRFCLQNGIIFGIASAGIDFTIRHLMRKMLDGRFDENEIHVFVGESKASSRGLKIRFKKYDNSDALDLKDDALKTLKANGNKVIYIGDGSSDFGAIRAADLRITVKGSVLSDFCRKNNLSYLEFDDFLEVIKIVHEFRNGSGKHGS